MQRRRSFLFLILAAVALTASLIVPAFLLNAAQYQALAAGVQAFRVVAALASGAVTLAREARDKRIDRVVALYDQFQVGDLFDARHRLVKHLPDVDGRTRSVSRAQLIEDPVLAAYPDPSVATPRDDVEKLLRLFESLNGMRSAGALDLPLMHRLLGGNILWWDAAFAYDTSAHLRQPLRDLAEWVREYSNYHSPPYIEEWRRSIECSFGPGAAA